MIILLNNVNLVAAATKDNRKSCSDKLDQSALTKKLSGKIAKFSYISQVFLIWELRAKNWNSTSILNIQMHVSVQ